MERGGMSNLVIKSAEVPEWLTLLTAPLICAHSTKCFTSYLPNQSSASCLNLKQLYCLTTRRQSGVNVLIAVIASFALSVLYDKNPYHHCLARQAHRHNLYHTVR